MKHNRRWLAGITALVLAAASVFVGVVPAALAADGDVEIIKTASTDTVEPGEPFTYTLTLTCTTDGPGCTNAQVIDDVPAEFIVDDVSVNGAAATITQDGQHVEVHFTEPLGPGEGGGIPGGATVSVTISVHVDPDLPYSASGIPVPNVATTDADTQTSGPLSDDVEVTPVVELLLNPDVTKTMSPPSALANPGEPVTANVTVTNSSNAAVDQLIISDPADPNAVPSPFDQLEFTGIGPVTYPDGAETAQIVYITASGPQAGETATKPAQPTPPDVPVDEVIGVQVVFTDTDGSGIPNGDSGGLQVDFVHPDDVVDLAGNLTVTNIAEGEVALDGQSVPDTGQATHQIIAADIDVVADKSFDPDQVAAGDISTATITAGNASEFNLAELTVTEPTLTDPSDPWADGFDQSMQFAGFAGPITYPTGATGATITYYYDDGTSTEPPAPFANGTEPPAPTGDVVRFEITFTGVIPPTATTAIPFDVQTDPDQEGYPATITNVADVTGTDPNGGTSTEQAIADLLVFEKHIEVITGKSIYPAEILDRPGEWVLVTLDATIAPFPRSTTDATTIVVQDPATPPASVDGTFWDYFNATQINETAVPDGATLTINYWNGSEWVPLLDENGEEVIVEGPAVFSMDIPADEQDLIQGLQFEYTADDGQPFPPGTSVEPHFTAEVRDTERDPTTELTPPATLPNCASSTAEGADGLQSTPSDDDTACDETDILPYDPDGDGPDVLDKSIAPTTVTARSQAPARITLNWSTGGLSGVEQVVIQDEAAPPAPASFDQSFWDAFDIVGVPAISAEMDPHLRYDQITEVQLWDGDSWERLENDPCPGACDGTFPGVNLTTDDRAVATGIRLLVSESPTRAETAQGDLTAPPVGSGVARSSGNDRAIFIDVQLRDYLRSDPSQPAVGSLDYNVDDGDPEIGTVRNVASATGTDANGEQLIHSEDDADILIIDVPLNVDLAKTWSNSPFGIPPEGTPQEAYPTGRVVLTATNRTAAKVDSLSIVDPGPTATENPFTYFDLYDIRQIGIPGGTETTIVTLTRDTDGDGIGDTTEDVTVSVALGMTSGQLADVVGIEVEHDGRIDAGAVAVVEMDLRLREDVRGEPGTRVDVTDSPVDNAARAEVDDAGGGTAANVPFDDATASVTLAEFTLGVDAGKSFDPDVQVEPDDSPVVMTLTGQPSIDTSARVGGMVIADIDPTFWNAFDFVGLDPSFTLATPINQVRMDVRTGGQFIETGTGLLHVGGTWTEGEWVDAADLAAFLADPLPAGVAAGDVNGIGFGFLSVDGTGTPVQWENPINPLQEAPVLVQRRAELRTGGEVPSDLTGNEPAPGEAAAGQFENESSATVCAILAVCELGAPGTVTDTATDIIYYQHATTAVTIDKQPTGLYAPGQTIPYTITVTNTGDWPIENPVITDAPAAPGTLMIDPDEPDPFTYILAGDPPAEPTGLPMPVDPADVTTTVDGTTDAITFTFPEGTVLEVGQTYTISIDMMFAPGVPGGQPVENTATITGDRPFDSCNQVDTEVDECSDETVVTPSLAGAVRSGKFVRAEDPELGAFDFRNGSPVGCLEPNAAELPLGEFIDPDDEGFYWYPCVPRSKPGGTVIWRLGVMNTGNVDLDRLVLVDRLPTPGDTGAINDNPRGSQWTPVLDPASLTPVETPDGATVTFSVTTDPDVCADDLSNPGEPGDPLVACGDGYWVDPASVADTSLITGIRTVVDMPENPMGPTDVILIDIATITPAVSATAGEDTIAFNTVATGAHTTVDQTAGQGGRTMVPSEGTKVGAALATGQIIVRKELTGDGIGYAPDQFTIDVNCTSVGVEIDPAATVIVTPGTPESVTGLPWGAECTLTETDQGQVDFIVTPETVVAQRLIDGVSIITIDNIYLLAGLEITKTVDSDAVDAENQPIDFGPFEVLVTCEFLDAPVFADGYDENDPMEFEIVDGQTVTLDGLPAGAECVVAETNTNGAASTTVASETSAGAVPPTEGTSTTVILTPDDDEQLITNSVEFVNAYTVGSLEIEKVLDPVDSPFATGPYLVQVTCTLGDLTTWDGELTLDVDAPVSIDNIATGSVCTVTETDDGFASETIIDPETVTIGDSTEPVTVQVTNIYEEGSVTVTKVFEGDDRWAGSTFEVAIICVDLSSTTLIVDIPGGPTRTLTADNEPAWTATYERLPAGAFCVMFETDDGGASSSRIVDENGDRVGFFEVQADTELQFDVVNTFEVSSLQVTKTTSGDGAELWGTGEFAVHLDCTAVIDGVATPIEIPDGADRTLQITDDPATATVTYEALPPGAECTVTEPAAAGASSVTITPNDGEDPTTGVVVVGAPGAEPVQVQIDNTFDVGSLAVQKTVSGEGAQWALGEFEVSLSCTWQGEEIVIPAPGPTRTMSLDTSMTATWDDLPDGAECAVEEIDEANASAVTITPETLVVDPDATETATFAVDNRYDVGSIQVRKLVVGGGADIGGDTTFRVSLACTWELQGETIELPIPGTPIRVLNEANGYTATYDGLPNGAECTLTETYSGGAGNVTILPQGGVVTVAENETVNLEVINTFDSGDLVIRKELAGEGAEFFAQGPFTVHVRCTLDDGELLPRLVYDEDVVLGGDQPLEATITGIPSGSECAIEETDAGLANETEVSPGTVVIGDSDSEPVEVVVTNTFLIGSVAVDKVITGDGAEEYGQGPFEVTLECVAADGETPIDIPGGAVRVLNAANGYATVYEALPAGALCGIAETDDGGADATRLLDADGQEVELVTLEDGTTAAFFTVEPGTVLDFTLENMFDAPPPLPPTGIDVRAITLAIGIGVAAMLGGVLLVVAGVRRRRLS